MSNYVRDILTFFGFLIVSFFASMEGMNKLSYTGARSSNDLKADLIISIVVSLFIAIITSVTTGHYKKVTQILSSLIILVLLFAPADIVRIAAIILAIFIPLSYLVVSIFLIPSIGSRDIQERVLEAKYTDDIERLKNVHNSKEWATFKEIQKVLNDSGPGLNATGNLNVSGKEGRIDFGFKFNKRGHLLTIGSARGGKGSTLVLNALLDNNLSIPGSPSFVVLDPKGENLAVSGRYLQSAGYRLIVINPFDIPEIREFGSNLFNPFSGVFLATDSTSEKYIDLIAQSIVPPIKSNNPFFDNSARNIIGIYIRHLMTQSREARTFRTLYRWVRYAGEDREKLLIDMAMNPSFEGIIQDTAMSIQGQLSEGGGREVESVFSTIRTYTELFGSSHLRRSTEHTDFNISDIAKGKTALFICLKPEDLKTYQAYSRILFNIIIRKMTEEYNIYRKLVMILDEFTSSLGYDKTIEESMAFIAGYNITLWPIIHDLTQLRSSYPNTWETFVNNTIVKHWIKIGDNFTAEYLSKRMPIIIKPLGRNSDGSAQFEKIPLLTAQQIMKFEDIIIEIDGVDSPARFPRIPYWQITKKFSRNPFFR